MALQLLICTCPDAAIAQRVAQVLVEKKLAACVNILPGLQSVYSWQNKVETAQEYLLLIKTQAESYKAVESCIQSLHPYEMPEIIAIHIAQGLESYLQWIEENASAVAL